MNHAVETINRAQHNVAANGGQHIGDLISWNAERIDGLRTSARAVFTDVGFAKQLIGELAPGSALTRAVGKVPRPKGVVVQPLRSRHGVQPD